MNRYDTWIAAMVKNTYGTCAETTRQMAIVFPELQRVRGHYYCPIWGKREHWWLKTADNVIVDPTKTQFPSRGLGEYVEWVEGTEEPTGVCPNCGEYCYDSRYVCSDKCEREYAAYCSRPF